MLIKLLEIGDNADVLNKKFHKNNNNNNNNNNNKNNKRIKHVEINNNAEIMHMIEACESTSPDNPCNKREQNNKILIKDVLVSNLHYFEIVSIIPLKFCNWSLIQLKKKTSNTNITL